MKEFMEIYDLYNDKIESNEFKFSTNVTILTNMLEKKGLIRNGEYQIINNVCIFPQEFFSPYDYANYETKITDESYCIHHFYKSWVPWKLKIKGSMKKILVKLIGSKGLIKLRKIIST